MPRAYLFPARGPVVAIDLPHNVTEMCEAIPQPLKDRYFITSADLGSTDRFLIVDCWHEKSGKYHEVAEGKVSPGLPHNKTIWPYFPGYPVFGDAILLAITPEEDEEGNLLEDSGVVDVDLPEEGSQIEPDVARVPAEEMFEDLRVYQEVQAAEEEAAKAATRLRMAQVLSGLVAIP